MRTVPIQADTYPPYSDADGKCEQCGETESVQHVIMEYIWEERRALKFNLENLE